MLCAIPMEIVNRELDGVLSLSLHLAKQGLPVLFGERMVHEYLFRITPDRPVLYFDQDQSGDVNQRIVDAGGYVFNLNNEGQNLDINPGVVELYTKVSHTFTRMFTRGEKQRDAVRDAFPPEKRDCVEATGHPAFDLLQERFLPYHERADIVAQHGKDYILINTQFAVFNHKMGFDNYLRMIARLKEWKDLYTDKEYLAKLEKVRDEQEKVANRFVKLAKRLATEFPDRHVIVRPHPTEGKSFYQSHLAGLDNAFVKHDGPVMPWLASSGAIIHYSCTTGVEGMVMGKKVVRYDPLRTGGEKNMQSVVGLLAESEDAAVELVGNGTMTPEIRAEQLDLIRPHAINCDRSAAEAIARRVAQYATEPTWLPRPLSAWESAKCWRKYISKLIRKHQPGHNGRKVRYALEKFPRLPFEEVARRVERIRACEPDLPEVELTSLGLNVFLMQPGKSA